MDYFGGATFATATNQDDRWGVTLGSYINIDIDDDITGRFKDRVITDPLFMHEYGHTLDSQIFGPSYLAAVGLLSLISASKAREIPDEPSGVTTHNFRWYEMRANRHAATYFGKYYNVDWDAEYKSHIIETYYPTKRR